MPLEKIKEKSIEEITQAAKHFVSVLVTMVEELPQLVLTP
jgi:hypothetical protein